jgi:hypothetical protein
MILWKRRDLAMLNCVVAFAGWLIGIYTYLTGRPPP